jgi:putative sterol carrier protein
MEDIAKAFDPNLVSNDFVADIQFKVSGEEPGNYYFHIEKGKCTLHEGIAESPKATINTPSEVWEAILQGEMNPQLAFFGRKFTVEGDLMLLLQLANLFKRG